MQISLIVNSVIDDRFLADWSTRVRSCNVRTNDHGYQSCEVDLDLPFLEAFTYYQQFGPLTLRLTWGNYRIWEGRIEDPTQFAESTSGLRITALGGWVAYNDVPYTALWSDRLLEGWKIITIEDNTDPNLSPERYEIDKNNRLYIAPKVGEAIGNLTNYAMIGYQIPHTSPRTIVGIQFDWEMTAPVGFNWYLQGRPYNWSFATVFNILTMAGTGALQTGAFCILFSFVGFGPQAAIDFLFYNQSGALYNVAAATGTYYVKFTNVRVITSSVNMVNTTLTANRAAGTNVTATVGSTARMFVGQRITVANGAGTIAETVIVLSVLNSTQFNATFVLNYVIGDSVRSLVIYPDEVIKDCVSTLNGINPSQVSSVTSDIQSQAIDLDQAVYEDMYPTDIINQLMTKSDPSLRQWRAMVYDNHQLRVRPRGSGVAWFTDITTLEIVRTLEQLANSTYAIFKTADDRTLRTSVQTDAFSVSQYVITKKQGIEADTLSDAQAATVRDMVNIAKKDPIPRATITLERLLDQYGNPYPLFFARADDTLTLLNIPPVLGAVVDKIRTLVIVSTAYDVMKNTLTLDLELAIPDINLQIAQALKG